METLNNSSAAEQRIFSPIRAVQKTGNTYSIPPFSEPSAGEKSLAASSCRIIQSFLMIIFLRNRIVKVSTSRITLAVSSTPITITASRSRASRLREPLNKSSTAEQRIFCSLSAVWKIGNTYSIPRFPKLSEEAKSLAVSSCRFNHSFLRFRPARNASRQRQEYHEKPYYVYLFFLPVPPDPPYF